MEIIYVFLCLTLVILLTIYLLIKLAKYLILRLFGPKIWDSTKKVFFVIASAFLIFNTGHRLYYFHDEMIYAGNRKLLNPDYATQMEVETYLMSQQNVIDLFEGKPPDPDRTTFSKEQLWTSPKAFDPRFYLVVRLRNNGDRMAWGVLDYYSDNENISQIDIPPLSPYMTDFKNVVLPALQINTPEYPQLKSTWHQLYTEKKGVK